MPMSELRPWHTFPSYKFPYTISHGYLLVIKHGSEIQELIIGKSWGNIGKNGKTIYIYIIRYNHYTWRFIAGQICYQRGIVHCHVWWLEGSIEHASSHAKQHSTKIAAPLSDQLGYSHGLDTSHTIRHDGHITPFCLSVMRHLYMCHGQRW